MSTESSRKIDGENSSLSGISSRRRRSDIPPRLLRHSGISAVAGAPLLFPDLQGPVLRHSGISRTACAFSLTARRGGPCKADGGNRGKESRGLGRPLFCLVATPLKASFHTAWLLNKISIAFAMLTPCEFMCFAEREGFEPPEPLSSTVFKTAAIDHSAISPIFCRDL